jgi:hypothetical protein
MRDTSTSPSAWIRSSTVTSSISWRTSAACSGVSARKQAHLVRDRQVVQHRRDVRGVRLGQVRNVTRMVATRHDLLRCVAEPVGISHGVPCSRLVARATPV